MHFFEVGTVSDPVNHGKQARCVQWREDAMPGPAMQVDRLSRHREKGLWGARLSAFIRGYDHQKRVFRHRYKALRPLRVPLQQVKRIGQAAWFSLEQAHTSTPITEIQLRKIMIAPA